MSEHIASRRMYVLIWAALLALTLLTAVVARVDLDQAAHASTGRNLPLNALVALVIAGIKATLVVMFFMHLHWSDTVSRMAALAGLAWLIMMFLLTVSDFFTRGWLTYPSQ